MPNEPRWLVTLKSWETLFSLKSVRQVSQLACEALAHPDVFFALRLCVLFYTLFNVLISLFLLPLL